MVNTNTNTKKKKKKGFTLIELIIVLAIMAILAAIAVPSFNAIRNNSRIKADQRSSESIQKAMMALVADGTITVPASGNKTVVISFDVNGSPTFAYTNFTAAEQTATGVAAVAAAGGAAATPASGALAEVKHPQESGKNIFTVTIDSNDKIAVVTGAAAAAGVTP